MKKEEGGIPRPQDQTREFIAFAGESSFRRGHCRDEVRRDGQGLRGPGLEPLDHPEGHGGVDSPPSPSVTPNPRASAAFADPILSADSSSGPP